MSSTVDVIVDKMKDAKEVYKDLKADQKKKMGLVMRDLRRNVPATVAKAIAEQWGDFLLNIKDENGKLRTCKNCKKWELAE